MTSRIARYAFFASAPFLFGASALSAAPATPTPTPRAKLSGGFGRTPVPGSIEGQSLADVVRAANSSHKNREQKPVAITNESLVKDPSKGRITTAKARSAPPPPPVATVAAPVPQDGAPAVAVAPGAEEARWREAAHSARRRVEELSAQLSALEGETKQLEADFYRWDDGQYRDRVIKPAWDKKREELETTKKELAAAQAELADLPDKARRAGALPGWLRE